MAQNLEHKLYVRSWQANVDYCIEQGIRLYACGQAGYASKLRLLKLFIRPDRSDPAMAAAKSEAR